MAFDIGSVVAHIQADISDFTSGIEKAQQDTRSAGESITGNFMDIAKVAAGMGLERVFETAVSAIKDSVEQSYQFAESVQFLRQNIDNLTGSAQKTEDILTGLSDLSKKGIFNNVELEGYTQRLLQMGIPQEKINDLIHNMANVTVGTSASLEEASGKMTSLSNLFGYMTDKGEFSVTMLARFSKSLGIPLLDTIAKQLGTTTEELSKTGSKTKITAADVEKAFSTMGGASGEFGTSVDKASSEAEARTNAMKTSFINLGLTVLGVSKTGVVIKGGLFDVVSNSMNSLTNFINDHQSQISGFFKMISQMFHDLQEVIGAFSDFVVTNFNTYLKPQIDAFQQWLTNVLAPAITSVWNNIIKPAFDAFSKWFTTEWNNIKEGVKGTWEILAGIIKFNWDLISGIVTIGLQILAGNWGGAWETVKSTTEKLWNDIKDIFNGIIDFVKGWGGILVDGITKPFKDAWNQVQDLANKIKGAMDPNQRHSPSLVDRVKQGVEDLNSAWGGLKFSTQSAVAGMAGTSSVGAVPAMAGGVGGSPMTIQINMDGAIISDAMGASRMAEQIGNGIIAKLKQNVRF